jgi:HAD superfamily hydrolase (TIGR01509 family)
MTLPRPVKGVVFDMDGLLCDTEVLYRDCMMAAAEAAGAELPFSVFQRMIGLPYEASDAVAKAHFGAAFDHDAFNADVMRRVHLGLEAGVALKAGVLEILDVLDAQGLPRAIATSSSHNAVLLHLAPSDILHRFGAVIARGDYERGKPYPDPYLRAAEAIGVAPEDCLALEDSHNGVRAAHAAGMMTVMVPDLLDPTEEMRTLCVHIADSLHHVIELITARGAAPRP